MFIKASQLRLSDIGERFLRANTEKVYKQKTTPAFRLELEQAVNFQRQKLTEDIKNLAKSRIQREVLTQEKSPFCNDLANKIVKYTSKDNDIFLRLLHKTR